MSKSNKKGRQSKGCIWTVFAWFASFKLACVLFIKLFLLTWLGTLEQVEIGLYPVIEKYFSFESWYVIPRYNGKIVPLPLLGGYWVCALMFLNILAGGVLRIRKDWRHFGVIMSHVGILLLLAGGMVTHHFSTRGMLMIWEGDTESVARDPLLQSIEVTELEAGGKKPKLVHLVGNEYLDDLDPEDHRLLKMKNLPFDIEVAGYFKNSKALSAAIDKPKRGQPVVEGYFLRPFAEEKQAEVNIPGCYIRLVSKEGEKGDPHILWNSRSVFVDPDKLTVSWEGKDYLIELCKKAWVLPFEVKLADFRAEFYPGTNSPKSFESDVVRLDETGQKPTLIKMNEPLRYKGFTLFQTNYGPQEGKPEKMYSVFEVVKNPSDQWPLYALLVSGIGLLIHFVMSLVRYLMRQSKQAKQRAIVDYTGKEIADV